VLQKQNSLAERLVRQQLAAKKEASKKGMTGSEAESFVSKRMEEYKKVELLRKAVRDVKKRGEDLEQKRKLKAKAYIGVQSKIARNIKIVDKVNREKGFTSPKKTTSHADKKTRPMSTMSQTGISSRPDFDQPWVRQCTNHHRVQTVSSLSKPSADLLTVARH